MFATLFALMDAAPTTKWGWFGWSNAFLFAVVFSIGAVYVLVKIRREDLWGSDFWGGVVFSVLALGLWWLSLYLFWGGTVSILFICAGLAFAFISFFLFIEKIYDSEKRVEKIGFTLLAAFCLVMTVASIISSYFQSIAWLASIPGAVAGFVMSIPLGIWGGTILAASLLTLLFNWRLYEYTESFWASGDRLDKSHVWRDERGATFGPGTQQQVYDHYHGQGSWFADINFKIGLIRFFAFIVPIVLPLAIVWIAGWYKVWSVGGLLLTAILTAISITGTVRVYGWAQRRWESAYRMLTEK